MISRRGVNSRVTYCVFSVSKHVYQNNRKKNEIPCKGCSWINMSPKCVYKLCSNRFHRDCQECSSNMDKWCTGCGFIICIIHRTYTISYCLTCHKRNCCGSYHNETLCSIVTIIFFVAFAGYPIPSPQIQYHISSLNRGENRLQLSEYYYYYVTCIGGYGLYYETAEQKNNPRMITR